MATGTNTTTESKSQEPRLWRSWMLCSAPALQASTFSLVTTQLRWLASLGGSAPSLLQPLTL
jgi:hypothetical protein